MLRPLQYKQKQNNQDTRAHYGNDHGKWILVTLHNIGECLTSAGSTYARTETGLKDCAPLAGDFFYFGYTNFDVSPLPSQLSFKIAQKHQNIPSQLQTFG